MGANKQRIGIWLTFDIMGRVKTLGRNKYMKKRILAALLSAVMVLSLAACGSKSTSEEGNAESTVSTEAGSWESIVEEAKGTTVTFYGWGGDDQLNAWLDDYFAPVMKEKYDITMERVPMNIEDILSQLSGELTAGKKDGDIDMIWINGENFRTTKDNNMLYGPFLNELPNYEAYFDQDDEENNYDFCYPIEGYEAPYGKAQLVMMADTAVVSEDSLPKSTEELLEFCKANKGKVTYPALPDFTGSAFVRNIIYDICGYEQFMDMEADKEAVKEAIEPALEYLRSLNPYLWNEGKTFPEASTTVDNMFADGELVLNMTYGAYDVATGIENGTYSETTTSFQFDKGTIGNTNYIAIAANSENPVGAMVAINEMMSPEVQASRFETIRTIPVVSYDTLNDEQKNAFDSVEIGKGVIPQDELLSKRLPEMPSSLVPIIEEIWQEEVVGK